MKFRALSCFVSFFLLLNTIALSQGTNPCGVKAVIDPGTSDSILTMPNTRVLFTSASINATSYKWIFGNYDFYPQQPMYWYFQPGLTKVRLVAFNGTCSDTATVYYFYPGTAPANTDNSRRLYGYEGRGQTVTSLTGITTGGYMMTGNYEDFWFWNEKPQGLMIKTKENGCVEWGRKITGNGIAEISTSIEAADGGQFAFGQLDYRHYIFKLDNAGNLLWSKVLEIPGFNMFKGAGMTALPDGGVAALGVYLGTGRVYLIRLSSTGNQVWQKEYDNNNFVTTYFKYVTLKDNFLYMGGWLVYNVGGGSGYFLSKIDYTTGNTIWSKDYQAATGSIAGKEIISVDSTLLINITGSTGINNVPTIGGYMHLDTAGNVLKAALIGETYVPNTLVGGFSIGNSQMVKSGKSIYLISPGSVSLSLQPGISYQTKYIRFDSAYNVKWARASGGAGVPRFFYTAPSPKEGMAISGYENGVTESPLIGGGFFSLKLIDSSGGNPLADCYFGDQEHINVPMTITSRSVQWTTDKTGTLTLNEGNLVVEPFFPTMRYKCPDYLDSCSYLKVSGPSSICNLNGQYTFKSHRNKACGQPAQWKLPGGAQKIAETDSTITVKFTSFGRHVIYAENTLSCTPVQDSIVILAESKTPPLELGPQKELCPGNTIKLKAGRSFFTYEWKDGSTDSILNVTRPGRYWIKVVDSCSNILYDTVDVIDAPPIPFDVGPDRVKCNADTIHLEAPDGFMNYAWGPDYNITGNTTRNPVITPMFDTVYTIKAELTANCFAFDTIRVKVNVSPPIYLGNDTSFCEGAKVILDAGAGFASYQWSNSNSVQQQTITAAGNYSVIGTTAQGCRSYDTLKVLQVYPNPVVTLADKPGICEGQSVKLDAGNFASYLWNNGSYSQTINVTVPGQYYVTVKDVRGCEGSDTTLVPVILPAPAGFLPVDTSICQYGTIQLKSIRSYNSYLWSTNQTGNSITISKSGQYWLEVTDKDQCAGRDSIQVAPKECMEGFYIPTAFTPDGNGRNDLFFPLVFGEVKEYHFTVFNRWGEKVFESRELGKGWNGSTGAMKQDTNVFVWVCSYRLEGKEKKVEKGSVVLIR